MKNKQQKHVDLLFFFPLKIIENLTEINLDNQNNINKINM